MIFVMFVMSHISQAQKKVEYSQIISNGVDEASAFISKPLEKDLSYKKNKSLLSKPVTAKQSDIALRKFFDQALWNCAARTCSADLQVLANLTSAYNYLHSTQGIG